MSSTDANVDVAKMALYSLARADACISSLSSKAVWSASDTASFDCMHYLGNSALDNAATCLSLRAGQTVLDIGSGFSGTGRYLHSKYSVNVVGVEYQEEIHSRAVLINGKNGLKDSEVCSINGDILQVDLENKVDHIVSLLCILHIPDREKLFSKAASLLKEGGRFYIEDYFARGPLSPATSTVLRNAVSCPYLPTKAEYITQLGKAGFVDVHFEDVTAIWAEFVHARALEYRKKEGEKDFEESLARFYDAVDGLFAGGEVGGVRISCTLRGQECEPPQL